MNIAGSNILVTGGASGLGLAFAERLSRRGARVWVVDRDSRRLDEARNRCARQEVPVSFRACDVGRIADVEATVAAIHDESGGLDVLVNNAAELRDQALVSKLGGKVRKHSINDWTETLRSNLTGTFLMAREVAATMIERGRPGLIVNLSSISRKGNAGQTAYAASKGAIDPLTRTWPAELAPYNIRTVAIAPGFVRTAMTDAIPPMFLEKIRERTPLKRFGTLDEFARTIEFVIENDYLNGTVLEVDGGLQF